MNPMLLTSKLTEGRLAETCFIKANNISKREILIIEEEYVNFLFLSEVFTSLNCNVTRVASLDGAVDVLEGSVKPDLIVFNDSLSRSVKGLINFLKKEYAVPVVAVVEDEKYRMSGFQDLVLWTDCIVPNISDAVFFQETMAEFLE